MQRGLLPHDPYNLIITGVGGQGNVLASRLVGEVMTDRGLTVTIGETFGASQRGGSVMSHLRLSSTGTCSPLIPRGRAHMVVALEPTEAVRVLRDYGNPDVKVLCNTRPIHSIGVISGEQGYPSLADLRGWIEELTAAAWFVDTTAAALELGNPVFGNVMAVGALAGTGELPLERAAFEQVLARKLPAAKVAVNLQAYDQGRQLVAAA